MLEPTADDLKELMAMYGEACREPAGGTKPRRKSASKKAAERPPPKVLFGRQLRNVADIPDVEIPPEFRVNPATVAIDSLMVEQLSEIAERPSSGCGATVFHWLRLSLLAGDPGIGKSLVALDIAARVSCGAPWPDLPGVLKERPQEATVLFEQGKKRGFSESTIRRAAASVGVTMDLKGFQSDRTSIWSLKQ